MKSFENFILEAYYHCRVLLEAKKPDYNYEEAFVRLFNYLTGSENKRSQKGKLMQGLILRSKGDSAEAASAMNEIVSILSREVSKAEKDPKHPLHFNNIPDVGFTGGAKTPAHESAYYKRLNSQKYTFLNFIQSKSGRSIGGQGLIAVRAGNEKTPLTSRGAEVYGKSSDTSKADVLFKDSSGEVVHTSSLKDSGGAVYASSGPEETKGNLLMGMYANLDARLENNEINQNEYDELVEKGTQLASEIALKMTTKGLSKEEERGIIDPEVDSRGLHKTMGEFEDSFPGISDYVSKEQITGKGKYGRGVDSVLVTNKGGELIEFPEFLSKFVKHRFRTSKHGVKGSTSQAADAQKVDPDVDRPDADPESSDRLKPRWVRQQEKEWEKEFNEFEPEVKDMAISFGGSGMDIRRLQVLRIHDRQIKDNKREREEIQNKIETNDDGTPVLRQHQANRANSRGFTDAMSQNQRSAEVIKQQARDAAAEIQAQKPETEPTQQPERKPESTKPQKPEPAQQPERKPESTKPQKPEPTQQPEPQETDPKPTTLEKPKKKKKEKPESQPSELDQANME